MGYARGRGIEGAEGEGRGGGCSGEAEEQEQGNQLSGARFLPVLGKIFGPNRQETCSTKSTQKTSKNLVGVFVLISCSILGGQKIEIWSKKVCVIEQENLAL